MNCSAIANGFTIPAADSPSLYLRSTATPVSLVSPLRHPTRVRFGSIRARTRIIDDGPVKQADDLSFYDLLGIPETGKLPQIKQAYKQLARKYHPDVSPPDRVEEYTERFIRVQEAYETLSDPRRRALYDRDLVNGISFAFSSRWPYRYDEEVMEEKSEWKIRWKVQLSELTKRSKIKDSRSGNSISWAARMRRQRQHMSGDSS